MIDNKTPGLLSFISRNMKLAVVAIKAILISLLLSSVSLASHHIDCNEPINSIFPECKALNTPTTPDKKPVRTNTASCISVIDPTNFQLTFDWLDIISSSGVISSYNNIIMDYKSGLIFSLIDAVLVNDNVKPEDLNCQNAFNIDTLSLSVPALKIGNNNTASFENLLFLYQSGLDFSLENIDEIK
ncbi:MAG: hypothetical protein KZQ83_09120 [gamma proteobacterium symbiont of Taylorina sp.]|nr:hypothetical protein [gamma proteobacterium symbiont of Taylorina sp.]